MDSLSQLALGAAVGVAVMGRRTALWKSAAWGALLGTLPDLDAFVDHGDAILNMTLHRSDSHALFWHTVLAPALGWGIARLDGQPGLWRRWWLAAWLALVTHPLLDTMTVYGTQLLQPFSDHPFGVGSLFIIDPLYTVPLLIGLVWTLASQRLRPNAIGLAFSCAYIAWSVAAQWHATSVARETLARQGVQVQHLLVTPAPFNTVLWRVVAVTPTDYREGFYSLLDDGRDIRFDVFDRGAGLIAAYRGDAHHDRMARFTHGFYKMEARDGRAWLSDLRMGQEPAYSFNFDIGPASGPGQPPPKATHERTRPDIGRALAWLWRRMGGDPVPPPR